MISTRRATNTYISEKETDKRAFLREEKGNCEQMCKKMFQWNNNGWDCRQINNSVRVISAVQNNALYFPKAAIG